MTRTALCCTLRRHVLALATKRLRLALLTVKVETCAAGRTVVFIVRSTVRTTARDAIVAGALGRVARARDRVLERTMRLALVAVNLAIGTPDGLVLLRAMTMLGHERIWVRHALLCAAAYTLVCRAACRASAALAMVAGCPEACCGWTVRGALAIFTEACGRC